jgi:dCMP deaminase
MSRPTVDQYFMDMAVLVSSRATCSRRQVGAVLVNDKNHVIATGYNGVPRDFPHCNEKNPCPGSEAPSGQGLDKCFSIHAEQNAMLQCKDVYDIHTAYVTASPCITCVKLLLNTSCKRIVFIEEYPHGDSKTLWEMSGREWVCYADIC